MIDYKNFYTVYNVCNMYHMQYTIWYRITPYKRVPNTFTRIMLNHKPYCTGFNKQKIYCKTCHHATLTLTTKFYKYSGTFVIMKKITKRKIKEIQELQKFGYTVRKIADKLNCSPTTVQKYSLKNRNNDIQLTNPNPKENLLKKTYAPASSQPNKEPYYQQPIQDHSFVEEPRLSREQYHIEAEPSRRMEEIERRFAYNTIKNQGYQEDLNQIKRKIDLVKQENKSKSLNITNKLIEMSDESYKKSDANLQELKEEQSKKEQEEQRMIDSTPGIIKVKVKEIQVHQKAQDDEIQKSKDQHRLFPVSLKQAEENENTKSESSGILEGAILGTIQGICEVIDSYYSIDSKNPMNQFDKYLKKDRKPKRVNLVIKR